MIVFFQALNAPKPVSDPAGGTYDAPPDPIVGWGGGTLFPSTFWRLDLGAYSASILRSHLIPNKIPLEGMILF